MSKFSPDIRSTIDVLGEDLGYRMPDVDFKTALLSFTQAHLGYIGENSAAEICEVYLTETQLVIETPDITEESRLLIFKDDFEYAIFDLLLKGSGRPELLHKCKFSDNSKLRLVLIKDSRNLWLAKQQGVDL